MNPQCVLGIEYVLQVVCYQEIFVLYFGGKYEERTSEQIVNQIKTRFIRRLVASY